MALTSVFCGWVAIAGNSGEMRVSVEFIFLPFVLKERTCCFFTRTQKHRPIRTKGTQLSRNRAAGRRSTEQWSAMRHRKTGCAKRVGDSSRLVARGCWATRARGAADGMAYLTETFIGGCRSLKPITGNNNYGCAIAQIFLRLRLGEASVCGRGAGALSGEKRLSERSRSETPCAGSTRPRKPTVSAVDGRIAVRDEHTRFARGTGVVVRETRADRKPRG